MRFNHSGSKQSIQLIALFLVSFFMLTACGPTGTKAPVEDKASTNQPVSSSDPIDEMIAGLDPISAISVLDNASTNSRADRAFAMLVRAAEIAIDHESTKSVDQRLSDLQKRFPDGNKRVQLAILENRILLSRKKPGVVIEAIDGLVSRATPEQKLALQSLKAEALHQAGFPIESVQLRIALDLEYQKIQPEGQAENDQQLWQSLMQVDPGLISGHISEIPDTFSGWLELAHVTHQFQFNDTALNQEIDKWISRNPDHPANRQIIDFVKKKQIATSKHPAHIALILPLSGKLASVGTAVRDGFMSAYLESSRIFGTDIKIDIYDTEANADRAKQAVKIANERGTEFIIGPLSKDAVTAAVEATHHQEAAVVTTNNANPPPASQSPAAATTSTPVPSHKADLLALNSVPTHLLAEDTTEPSEGIAKNKPYEVFQFDLAPETEALQVAERASISGLNHAMVMVPENIWGNRIYEAFTKRYQELGGEVVALHRFKKASADYSSGIQQGLKLDISKLRHKQLEALLQEDLGFTPRRRKDLDMIFIAASPQEARLIKPQLKFFYADDIPVYATSSIYTGGANPARDKDLENITFCDMPWVLTNKPAPGSLQRTISTAWPQESTKYLRFYALGADAFLLLPQLDWLKKNNSDLVSGGTGQLSLASDGVVQRQLSWARFQNAVPEIQHAF